jgi:integrase
MTTKPLKKPLTDVALRKVQPKATAYKLYDGTTGLFMLVEPNGAMYWRLRYQLNHKETMISFGVYPAVGLSDARKKLAEARVMLANGVDPAQVRKDTAASKKQDEARAQEEKRIITEGHADSFEAIAREWFANKEDGWVDSHSSKIIRRLEKEVFPFIGRERIGDIKPAQVLTVVRQIEARNLLETAHRTLGTISMVFRYGVQTSRVESNPCRDLSGALKPHKTKNFPTITDPVEVGKLLRAFDAFKGGPVVSAALRLLPYVFTRPGEFRKAEWKDIDLDEGEWKLIASKTKTPHFVPLSRQAVLILRELQPLTGAGRYVFPGERTDTRPMSDAAIGAAIKRLGFSTKDEITPHGFRSMARTLLAERLHFKPEIIEHQLAHKVPDALGTAYNRTKFLADRVEMMQQYCDYLESLKLGAEVLPIKRTA